MSTLFHSRRTWIVIASLIAIAIVVLLVAYSGGGSSGVGY